MRYPIIGFLVLLAGCETFMRHDDKTLDVKLIMDSGGEECRVEYRQNQTTAEGEDTKIINSPIN